ncbi:MAG: nucleotide pyrophosphatase, partial [Herbinix sp.]|nr:nucleotide pyrophosphatase [Herbinix sp.]
MSTIIFPDYDRSLLSITSSVLKNYNVNLGYKTLEYLDNILNRNYRNVIFYLIDAMGSEILNKHHQESKFLINNRVDNLTTVFPSTTVAATTTAITGLPPVVSGWLG